MKSENIEGITGDESSDSAKKSDHSTTTENSGPRQIGLFAEEIPILGRRKQEFDETSHQYYEHHLPSGGGNMFRTSTELNPNDPTLHLESDSNQNYMKRRQTQALWRLHQDAEIERLLLNNHGSSIGIGHGLNQNIEVTNRLHYQLPPGYSYGRSIYDSIPYHTYADAVQDCIGNGSLNQDTVTFVAFPPNIPRQPVSIGGRDTVQGSESTPDSYNISLANIFSQSTSSSRATLAPQLNPIVASAAQGMVAMKGNMIDISNSSPRSEASGIAVVAPVYSRPRELTMAGLHCPMYLSRARTGYGSQKETRRRCKICRTRIAMICKECDVALCFATSTSDFSCWEKHHMT